MKDLIILTSIGIICGISVGSLGIGGGIITIPLLLLYGINFKNAVAIVMLMQLLPQSIFGVYNYWNYINWLTSFYVIFGSIMGILIGSYIVTNNYIKEEILYKLLTIFLIIISIFFYIKYFL